MKNSKSTIEQTKHETPFKDTQSRQYPTNNTLPPVSLPANVLTIPKTQTQTLH
jgi:hypothetical protein